MSIKKNCAVMTAALVTIALLTAASEIGMRPKGPEMPSTEVASERFRHFDDVMVMETRRQAWLSSASAADLQELVDQWNVEWHDLVSEKHHLIGELAGFQIETGGALPEERPASPSSSDSTVIGVHTRATREGYYRLEFRVGDNVGLDQLQARLDHLDSFGSEMVNSWFEAEAAR